MALAAQKRMSGWRLEDSVAGLMTALDLPPELPCAPAPEGE